MDEKGFLGALFDMSFTDFITTRIIKVLFAIGIVASFASAVGFIVGGFAGGFWRGLFFVILSPIPFVLGVLASRVSCELIIVLFRIAENTGLVAGRDAQKSARGQE